MKSVNGIELNSFEFKLFNVINNIFEKNKILTFIVIIILVMFSCGLFLIPVIYCWSFYTKRCKEVEEFYNSQTFKEAVKNFHSHIKDMNNFSEYVKVRNNIEEKEFVQIAQRIDNSNYNYKQKKYQPINNNQMVINCSLTVLRNAENNPFKYIQKYFSVPTSEKSIEYFENLSSGMEFASEAIKYRNFSTRNILTEFRKYFDKDPNISRLLDLAIIKSLNEFYQKIGLNRFDTSNLDLKPIEFTFRYISPGGNKNQIVKVTFKQEIVDLFVDYLANDFDKKKSTSYQRSLMTTKLRTQIKERDNYTCQKCHNSIHQEPNLLLEIDHIIPISKGGLTEEDNLQTLCWRCNRSKSNKIE